jgi:lipopolysaccharide biosynthesis regulator YciM
VRSVRSYQRELKILREMVASMLWVQPTYNGNPSCSYCGEQQHNHTQHCAATKLVAEHYPAEDEIRLRAVLRG